MAESREDEFTGTINISINFLYEREVGELFNSGETNLIILLQQSGLLGLHIPSARIPRVIYEKHLRIRARHNICILQTTFLNLIIFFNVCSNFELALVCGLAS